ncbi:hypothetical protein X992_5315 [Burkholderia pseudomallei MSHR5492]|nr:hypothetical protein DO63_5092 [Burkholderia pseudomallei]KGS19461.1 hypothetical protein X989_4204 [Burkholderia pseudomallei MSHR4378]KGS39143.1 hypothetical protein X992_5315 [Burkholderia pseudomallei MSHR5492]
MENLACGRVVVGASGICRQVPCFSLACLLKRNKGRAAAGLPQVCVIALARRYRRNHGGHNIHLVDGVKISEGIWRQPIERN